MYAHTLASGVRLDVRREEATVLRGQWSVFLHRKMDFEPVNARPGVTSGPFDTYVSFSPF